VNAANRRPKVVTIVGTRPEIIRLSAVVKRLDRDTDHILVHTGQNYDYELNEIFFRDLGLRKPDHFLGADTSTLGTVLGSILAKSEAVLKQEKPDATLILGDTNSSIAALMSKRLAIPVYHMEAGNRSFDENVPEEVNRKFVDHVADYNLVYTEHARRNLLQEGIHSSRIFLTGSPMREVLDASASAIESSQVLDELGVSARGFFLASVHREENVDSPSRLAAILNALRQVGEEHRLPVVVSTHPRTRAQLENQPERLKEGLIFHAPFGFNDYVRLQCAATVVLSDSGTISEESSILGFSGVSLRDAIERPEAIDVGVTITAGTEADRVAGAVRTVLGQYDELGPPSVPWEYQIADTSRRVVNVIRSTALTHHARAGIRRTGRE
jgi:UDP-N-acetylglucosamine 2-epimerase